MSAVTPGPQPSPWVRGLNHLALVIDDLEKGKWFYGTVLGLPFEVWRETQLLVAVGCDLLVVKLSEDAVDKNRQTGAFGKQVLDHYGFFADSPQLVDSFAARLKSFGIEIVKGPYDRDDGRSVYFRDPFGNLIEYLWYTP